MKLVNEAKGLVSERLASAPASPVPGRRYFDTTRNVERYWNGTAWIDLDEPVSVRTDLPPAATTEIGDLWWDSDETAPGITTPLTVVNGGTGATSPAAARASLSVPSIGTSTTVAGPPTAGAWARGDQWLDSANVVWTCVTAGTPGSWACPPGTELAYVQGTGAVSINTTTEANATLVLDAGTRTFDGSPIFVEFNCHVAATGGAAASQLIFSLWDLSASTGLFAMSYSSAGLMNIPIHVKRRITPTAGTHNYRIGAHAPTGTGPIVYGGVGGAGAWLPMYVRITRA